jgi:hypothetical protein
MDKQRFGATAAVIFGLAAGSYGVASAASGNGSTTTTTTTPRRRARSGHGAVSAATRRC